jgi:hypothetical protein
MKKRRGCDKKCFVAGPADLTAGHITHQSQLDAVFESFILTIDNQTHQRFIIHVLRADKQNKFVTNQKNNSNPNHFCLSAPPNTNTKYQT